ncbi:hypothetical protein BTUL_0025g00160 [Botrytis tulipae]|uniref:2EXR domain-containing protein n=1 Tax=Botrytis tulipae TaxID=87230 RepID=A0A4Z1F0R9_9HELO|nr:hypothetical protein BTUL_0025g00160 [Botrytis tulipae]
MSKYHPLSNYYLDNKEDIPLTTSQENQPLSTTLQSIMAAPFNSSLRKGYKVARGYKTTNSTRALNSAEKSILVHDDDSNQSNADQTKDLVNSSPDWNEKRKGRGKGRGNGRRRGNGKRKRETTEVYHPYWNPEIDKAKPSLTISGMPTAPSDNKEEPDQLATDKMVDETSDHRKKLPTEIWIQIWELAANSNPRNLDIWTWSERPEKLWEIEKQRIINGPQNYSTQIGWNPFKFVTTQVVPLILHVSCLSRLIGLKYYKLGFGCHLGMPKTPSEDYSTLEPRIYCHKDDIVCPMGRFTRIESKCFWDQFPKEISAIALNVGALKSVTPKLHEDNDVYKKLIAHEHLSYEYFRGLNRNPDRFDKPGSFLESYQGEKFSSRASKIYLYYFNDYICKQGPRDFRFTPPVDDSFIRSLHEGVESDFSFDNLLERAAFTNRVHRKGQDDMYREWVNWLRYGGLTWLKDEGPKPGCIITHNPTPYNQTRNEFLACLRPWQKEIFIKRGVPNIGINSKFWVPGVPEVQYMNLEIHG